MEPDPAPRAARLAAWATAWLSGRCDTAAAEAGVVAADSAHQVTGLPGESGAVRLPQLLRRLAELAVTGVRYADAAPGDVSALPGPPEFNAQALARGGAALVLPGPRLGLVPDVDRRGPSDDTLTTVTWVVLPVSGLPLPPVDLRQARRRLAEDVAEALAGLHRLDVARGREAATLLARGWSGRPPSAALPPGTPVEAIDLLDRAVRLRQVVALALADDGGSVTGAEATQRRRLLVTLDRTLRQVEADAWNAGLVLAP